MSNFVPKGEPRYRHQRQMLRRIIETRGVCALLCSPGTGKALDITTPVPTPSGWTTMGDLRTGDVVYAPDGSETKIIAHEPYEAETFSLTFGAGKGNRVTVVADGDHLWEVETRKRGGGFYPSTARTTAELADTLNTGGKRSHLIRMTQAVLGRYQELPIEPYALGVWLGDGDSASGRLTLSQQDGEEIAQNLRDRGHTLNRGGDGEGCAYWRVTADPSICRRGHTPRENRSQCRECNTAHAAHTRRGVPLPPTINISLNEQLRVEGMLGNKHIPAQYLRAHVEQRLELLRGLVDTDGHMDQASSRVEITLTDRKLAEGVRELVASLGERVSIHESAAMLNGKEVSRRWRLGWTPRLHSPGLISRRSCIPDEQAPRLRGRYLLSAEPAGVRKVRCITVESSTKQYLVTRDWIATHNTAPTLDYLSIAALKSSDRVDGVPEIRAMVVSPKAAVDNWVLQAEKYVHDDVNVWAEALGGSIKNKAQTLQSRGPSGKVTGALPRKKDTKNLARRGLNVDRSELLYTRGALNPQGVSDLRVKPRLVLLSMGYEMFSSRDAHGSQTMADVLMRAVKSFRPHVIIADEMHKLKGPGSNTSRLMNRIGQLAPRRIGLTGTVMPNSPLDVFAQWRFLEPTAFGRYDPHTGGRKNATFSGFKNRYGVLGGFMGREVVSYQNLDEMQRIMAKNAIVVRKEDALDLPSTRDIPVPVVLTDKEQKIYDEMKSDLATRLETTLASVPNKLTQVLRLRQITAGHLPDDDGNVQTIGTSKINTIVSLVHDTLEGEKRVVIFGVFKHEIRALRDGLTRSGTEVLVIDGSTPDSQRLAMRQRFGSSDPARLVLIAQVKTISLSVNELVTASHAIFASLSLQRDDLTQARDRLHRIGQKDKTTFWYALARKTVDEVIYRSHQSRTDLETAVLRHIQGNELHA